MKTRTVYGGMFASPGVALAWLGGRHGTLAAGLWIVLIVTTLAAVSLRRIDRAA